MEKSFEDQNTRNCGPKCKKCTRGDNKHVVPPRIAFCPNSLGFSSKPVRPCHTINHLACPSHACATTPCICVPLDANDVFELNGSFLDGKIWPILGFHIFQTSTNMDLYWEKHKERKKLNFLERHLKIIISWRFLANSWRVGILQHLLTLGFSLPLFYPSKFIIFNIV